MKKILKISFALIILIFLINNTIVFGSTIDTDVTIGTELRNEAKPVGDPIIGAFKVVGTFIAVIVIMLIGIKYMLGSVEEKAEYKKSAIPYLVGAMLVFATPFIIDLIYNVFN